MVDGFRYVGLDTSILLEPGDTYVIGAGNLGPSEAFNDLAGAFNVGVGNTIVENRFVFSASSLAYPGDVDTLVLPRWAGANAAFIVPEPSTITLVGLGIVGVAIRYRRQQGADQT